MYTIHSIKNGWIIGTRGFWWLTNKWGLRLVAGSQKADLLPHGGWHCLATDKRGYMVYELQVEAEMEMLGNKHHKFDQQDFGTCLDHWFKQPKWWLYPFDDPVWGSHNHNLCYSPVAGWDYETTHCSARSFHHRRSGSRAGSRQRWDSSARRRRLPGLGPEIGWTQWTRISGDWASFVCRCLLETKNGDSNRCWNWIYTNGL